MPLKPKHPLFPCVFLPHYARRNPRKDTIGTWHKNLCTDQGVKWLIPLERGGFLTPLVLLLLLLPPLHLLPLSGGEWAVRQQRAARHLRLPPGPFFGSVGFAGGGQGGGFGFLGTQGLCLGGAAGAWGVNPQMDSKISSSAPPSWPN